jgi:Predicted polymerase, most proteins contain PALM domain, HD hydrolase domain and Zn-ribbon domain
MSEKDLPSSGKELPPSFDLKFWELEKDINSLKETELLKDEEKIFEELLSKYGGLDENMQKEIQAFKLLVDSTVAEGIDTLTAIDGSMSLKISENHQQVFLGLTLPVGKGKFVLKDEIAAKLKNEGICFGIKEDAIDRFFKIHTEENKEITDGLIAEGREPKYGTDGNVELFFEQSGRKSSDDNALTQEYTYENVTKGQILARVFPSTRGAPGRDVFNNDLPAVDGTEARLIAGENVVYSPEKEAFVSAADGIAEKKGNTLVVKHVLVISGDVDVSRGNVVFDGVLRIEGTIRDGLSVKARGDILIRGGVEGATVVSNDGSITVCGGIVGKGRCYVSAGKDVRAKFIENGIVYARENISVQEAILHSRISAGEKVSALSGKGTIAGGVTKAGSLACAKKFGAPGEPHTLVKLGINLASQREIENIEQQLALVRQTSSKISETLEKIMGTSANMANFNEETRQKLTELKKTVLILHYKEQRLISQIDNLEQNAVAAGNGKLSATETVFHNVHVSIGNAMFHAQSEYQRTTLHYDPKKQKITIT